MITSKIAANQAFTQINRIVKRNDASAQEHGNEEVIKHSKGNAVDGIKSEISSFSTHPLQQFNAAFNAVVKSIRIADKAMGEIEANVEQMESEVEMFLKQYPPFPPGSEERVKYLNCFALLRKQIDQLAFPPDAGAQAIMGHHPTGQAKTWEIEIAGNKTGHAIRHQPMHSGRDGLSLPEISPQATDDQIRGLRDGLQSARQQIQQSRADLAEDAIQMIRSVE